MGKNWIAQKAIDFLNKELKTQFAFDKIDINYFGDVKIYNLSAKDYKGHPFIKIKTLRADSDWLAIVKNSRSIAFKALEVNNLDMQVITYKGDSIANFVRFVELFDNGKPRDPNKPPFELRSGIKVLNSKVSIINQNSAGDAGKWLDAKDVNLHINHLLVKGPDVSAQMEKMSFITERWGKKHHLQNFSTNFSLTKQALQLDDLTIDTDNTLLKGKLKFNLNNGKWTDFGDKVKWEMDLAKESQVSGHDISYFVTNWDNHKALKLSGAMEGVLNDFRLKNFVLGADDVSISTPNIKIANILNRSFLVESEKISTDFSYKSLKSALPSFISKKMGNVADDFGRLKYNGSVAVNPLRVFAKGNLITGVGQADIYNFSLTDFSNKSPKFETITEVKNLNIAAITKTKQVGLVSGKFDLKGESFDLNTMKLHTQSNIHSIELLDKKLHNLVLNGYLANKKYDGLLKINDQPAKADINGVIDFSSPQLVADVKANIDHLNINYFTGKNGKQIVSGQIDGKATMKDINDLHLDANLQNLRFTSENQEFFIPMTELKTFVNNGVRTIYVDAPNAIEGTISGKYNLSDFSGIIQNSLNKILVGMPPRQYYKGQFFDINFDIEQAFVNYFEPNIRIPNGLLVEGSYNGNTNDFILNANSDYIKYMMAKKEEISDEEIALAKANPDYKLPEARIIKDSITVNSIALKINTSTPDEQIWANIGRLQYQNNVLRDVNLLGKNENDTALHLIANVKHGSPEDEEDNKMRDYAVHLKQSVDKFNDLVFQFEPTQVKFNNFAWRVDTSPELNHSITYRKKSGEIVANHLRFFSDKSEIFLNGNFKSAKDFNADIEAKNVEISKLLALQGSKNLDIQGTANGIIKINMTKERFEPIIDLKVDDILMNNKEMGDLVINAKNNEKHNIYDINATINSSDIFGHNNLDISGTINNNTQTPTADLTADLKDFDLAFAQEFVKSVFGNFRGKANGELKINGKVTDLNYGGDISISNFGLKLLFTGVDYTFDDASITLMKGTALINPVNVKDSRKNSKGNISGAIYFETLSNMGIQLFVNADNLLLLDTQQKDFDLFWGRVYGQGDLYVSGPVSSLDISTPNSMRVMNGSTFTFNSNFTTNVDEFKMLRFLKEDKKKGTISAETKKASGANMNIDFSVDIDKGSLVNVLVGDDMGDISVRGNAEKLRFRMFRSGNIMMNGNYFVDSGTYVSKAILEKTFQIARGSNLRWDGNAMSPQLDITANYTRNISNVGQYLNIGSIPPVNVVLGVNITETLTKPKVDLSISAPDVSSQIQETLATKLSNEDEKIIQFGSVLMLNSFNVMNTSDGFGVDATSALESTGYNMLFKQLGAVINTLSREFQIDLDYIKNNENSNYGDRANASVTLAVSPRIKIKTGLGVPISSRSSTSTTVVNSDYLSGEGIIEYDWSKKNDGSRLFRAYSKPSNIGLVAGTSGAANQTYGAGVVYSKSFNSLFKRKKKLIKDSIKYDSVK